MNIKNIINLIIPLCLIIYSVILNSTALAILGTSMLFAHILLIREKYHNENMLDQIKEYKELLNDYKQNLDDQIKERKTFDQDMKNIKVEINNLLKHKK